MKWLESKAFKNFMSKLYGWGAAVVIVGALFKIQHWPGAGVMLTIGLGVEALIFFVSAFEKPHEEPDWTLVYPELAGIDTDELDEEANPELPEKAGRRNKNLPAATTNNVQSITLSTNLDKMLEEANIGPELIENLGAGLKNLTENASKLADISNAALATENYIKNMEAASRSVLELSQSYKNTNEYLKHDISLSEEFAGSMRNAKESLDELNVNYKETAGQMKENLGAAKQYNDSLLNLTGYTSELVSNYGRSSELLVKTVEALENSAKQGSQYTDQLQKTSQNLEALNAVYELQLQASDAQFQNTEKMQESVSKLVENLNQTVGTTQEYKEQMTALTKNIASLNSVYGNMLTAMNFNGGK